MIYRMKQNAVGLANICILSTMVLVMVSSTTSMMVGMEDILKERYPTDFTVYSNEPKSEDGEKLFDQIRSLQKEQNQHITNEIQYTFLNFSAYRKGDTFEIGTDSYINMVNHIHILFFVPLSDYNSVMGENKTLNEGEILLYSER